MSGILLSPGPIATQETVKGLSRIFHNAVNAARFLSVATKLEDAGFGVLSNDARYNLRANVFVKKRPEEVKALLVMKENKDLCLEVEYNARYELPLPSGVSKRMRENLVQAGLIPDRYLQDTPGPVTFARMDDQLDRKLDLESKVDLSAAVIYPVNLIAKDPGGDSS